MEVMQSQVHAAGKEWICSKCKNKIKIGEAYAKVPDNPLYQLKTINLCNNCFNMSGGEKND